MRQFKVLAVAVLLGGVIPVAHASHMDGGKAHFGLVYSHPLGSPTATLDGDKVRLDADDDIGFFGDVEIDLKHNLGLKFGVSMNDRDIDVKGGSNFTTLRDRTYSANLLYHFTPDSNVDFYAGGGFAFVNYDSLPVHEEHQPFLGGNRVHVRSDRTWNVEGGVDISFDDAARWGLNIGVRYLKSTVEERRRNATGGRSAADLDIEVDPVSLSVGASYRW